MWCVRGVTGCIDIEWRWVALAGVVLQLLAVAFDRAKPCATTGPAGLGLLLLGLGRCMRKLLVYQRHIVCKSMHQIEPFGGQNWKKSLPWEGGQPHLPPARSLRSFGLGRFAPSQSHNLFRNFLFEMLGGLYLVIFMVVLVLRISWVSPRENFHQYMTIHSNENITKLSPCEVPNIWPKSWKYLYAKYMAYTVDLSVTGILKGKFSSGREGALASKFNYDFK